MTINFLLDELAHISNLQGIRHNYESRNILSTMAYVIARSNTEDAMRYARNGYYIIKTAPRYKQSKYAMAHEAKTLLKLLCAKNETNEADEAYNTAAKARKLLDKLPAQAKGIKA